MSEPDETFDITALLAETLELLTVRPGDTGEGSWQGDAPDWFGDVLFGGFVIAQAIIAATRNAPDGRRLHSMHAYFLRPVLASRPISYQVRPIREGRSFTSRHVDASQDGRPVLDMTCSFTADTDGYVYDLPLRREVPTPGELTFEEGGDGPGPWIAARL